jgi:hypothetical protein
LDEVGVRWLTNLFNKILSADKMPDEWKESTLIPTYKKKKSKVAQINVGLNL